MQSGTQPVVSTTHQYTIKRTIAKGSYGTVYEATDQETDTAKNTTNKSVAIKKICELDETETAVCTLRELIILRLLNKHPHIIELKNILDPKKLKDPDSLFVVFEKMDTDLEKIFKSMQRFSNERISNILLQLLIAVQYLHAARIAHRDLKPANILINADSTVKLCDFGLSRIIPEDAETKSEDVQENTGSNSTSDSPPPPTRRLTEAVVTRWYRAPEVVLQADYGLPIDMWSIGCIFAQLLMMQLPRDQRKVLFPGDYCSPTTPHHYLGFDSDSDSDSQYKSQLDVIFSYFKKPSDEDLAAICPDKTTRINLNLLFNANSDRLKQEFAFVENKQAIDLLEKLLELNPNKRITAEAALKHPFLVLALEEYKKSEKQTLPLSPFSESNRASFEEYKTFEDELAKQKECGKYPDVADIQKKILAEIGQHYPSARHSTVVYPEQKPLYSPKTFGVFPGPNPYTVTGLPAKTVYSGPAFKPSNGPG